MDLTKPSSLVGYGRRRDTQGMSSVLLARDPNSSELEDGCLDSERYQKYFKFSVTRRRQHLP
jgi:hypothetical protein